MLNNVLRRTAASSSLRRMDVLASRWGCTGISGWRYATTLGIRREDPKRIWERRVPLTPEAVEKLIKEGDDVKVEVESCERRCFPNESYTKVSLGQSRANKAGRSTGRPSVDERCRCRPRDQRAARDRSRRLDQRWAREASNVDGLLAYSQGAGECWPLRLTGTFDHLAIQHSPPFFIHGQRQKSDPDRSRALDCAYAKGRLEASRSFRMVCWRCVR